jgi:hypothetical protein
MGSWNCRALCFQQISFWKLWHVLISCASNSSRVIFFYCSICHLGLYQYQFEFEYIQFWEEVELASTADCSRSRARGVRSCFTIQLPFGSILLGFLTPHHSSWTMGNVTISWSFFGSHLAEPWSELTCREVSKRYGVTNVSGNTCAKVENYQANYANGGCLGEWIKVVIKIPSSHLNHLRLWHILEAAGRWLRDAICFLLATCAL